MGIRGCPYSKQAAAAAGFCLWSSSEQEEVSF